MKANACCALTMVYKDYEFLRKWVDYYGGEFGDTNLFVISHGEDEVHKEICKNINLISIPRFFDESFEGSRWVGLTYYSNYLLEYFSAIIVGDCDELIAIDPDQNVSLESYILKHKSDAIAPVGANVYSYDNATKSVNWDDSVLKQVPWVCSDASFTKPSILKSKKDIGFGGHGLINSNFFCDHRLVLFHLKYADEMRWRPKSKGLIEECEKIGLNDKNVIGKHWYNADFQNLIVERMRERPVSRAENPIRQTKNLLERRGKFTENSVLKYRQLTNLARNFVIPERFHDIL